MSTALALSGWPVALVVSVLLARVRRRLELVARAEHELRGPLTVIALGVEALGRERDAGQQRAATSASLEAQLDRARAEIGESGAGGTVRVDWRVGAATVRTDRGRLAQALGNVLANAVEHGGGDVRLRGLPVAGGVRIEIEDRGPGFHARASADGRGRGLAIAARAIEDAGGALSVSTRERGATVALELPLAER